MHRQCTHLAAIKTKHLVALAALAGVTHALARLHSIPVAQIYKHMSYV